MNKILLVFDFFGVICSEISPFWLKKYFSDEETKKIREALFYKVDVGMIMQSQLFEELSQLSGIKPESIEHEWMNLVSINNEVLNLIKEYKNTCHIALLTNASAPFVRRIINENHLEDYFELILVSSEEKLAKPDINFYKLLLDKFGVEPKSSIMIDDNIKNIEAAKLIHMNTIHFQTVQKLKQELKKYNI
jgi:HAD superfamily hydrolase (TIGR01509 family)